MKKRIGFLIALATCASLLLSACAGGATTTTATTTGDGGTEQHAHDCASVSADVEAATVEYVCSCGESETVNMPEFKVTTNMGSSSTTKGEIVIPGSSSHGGGNFIGCKIGDTVYRAGTTLTISEDTYMEVYYNSTSEHIHSFSKLEGSVEPTCNAQGLYKLSCSCGHTEDRIVPARGHVFSEYRTSADGKIMRRACFLCGLTQEKSVPELSGGKILAIGDSLTFGTKLDSSNSAYPKLVADALGYEVENIALPGSEAYQWNSVLTGKPAVNNKQWNDINGLTREDILAKIEGADIVVMTLGANDVGGYLQWRSPKQIKDALTSIIDVIHSTNPDAKVVVSMFSFLFKYGANDTSDEVRDAFYQYNNLVTRSLNGEKYNDFVFCVDITRIMSTASLFEDVADPDYTHPGYEGHKAIAALILDHLNFTK